MLISKTKLRRPGNSEFALSNSLHQLALNQTRIRSEIKINSVFPSACNISIYMNDNTSMKTKAIKCNMFLLTIILLINWWMGSKKRTKKRVSTEPHGGT
jgi:hypothetical protein